MGFPSWARFPSYLPRYPLFAGSARLVVDRGLFYPAKSSLRPKGLYRGSGASTCSELYIMYTGIPAGENKPVVDPRHSKAQRLEEFLKEVEGTPQPERPRAPGSTIIKEVTF